MTALPDRLLAYAVKQEQVRDALGIPAHDFVDQQEIDDLREAAAALSVRVPEGDMARALEWLRYLADKRRVGVIPTRAREYLPVFEEAIAAYDPKAGGRTALSGREAVAKVELNGLSMSGLVYTEYGIRANLRDGTLLYTTPQPGDGWRPIAEAPKDGTTILVATRNYQARTARWSKTRNAWLVAYDKNLISASCAQPFAWKPLPIITDATFAEVEPAAPSAKVVAS